MRKAILFMKINQGDQYYALHTFIVCVRVQSTYDITASGASL